MKKLILSAFVVFASWAGQAKTILNYNFADGHGVGFVQYSAELSDEGVLTVLETKRFDPRALAIPELDSSPLTTRYDKQLNPANFRNLLWQIQGLSNAKTQVLVSNVVCKLFPSPAMGVNHLSVLRGYDYQTESYKGEMALVHGPQGCWLHSKTSLVDEFDNLQAVTMKAVLRAVILEVVYQ